MSENIVKILDVGSSANSIATTIYGHIPNLQVTRLDISPEAEPDVLHDITQPLPEELQGAFDIVLASHVIEHVDRDMVNVVMNHIASAVRNHGEVMVIVPSLEWACREILAGHENAGVQGIIFGAQRDKWDYHRCGFTLKALRFMVELTGLVVRKAYQSPMMVSLYGHDYPAIQNVVIATRIDELNEVQDGSL